MSRNSANKKESLSKEKKNHPGVRWRNLIMKREQIPPNARTGLTQKKKGKIKTHPEVKGRGTGRNITEKESIK